MEPPFLQSFTIDFLPLFPRPPIPSEQPGLWGNYFKSMSVFLFGDILPITRRNSLPKVWMCHLFVICHYLLQR